MIRNRYLFAFALVLLLVGAFGHAQASDPIYTSFFSNSAVGGYDVVTYFQDDGVPKKGKETLKYEWQGANWYFSSQQNLDAFKQNPEKYAPQYGGYCAWAAAHDSLAKGDPQIYTLHDGKLYLNYDKEINEKWLAQKSEFIEKADQIYPTLVE